MRGRRQDVRRVNDLRRQLLALRETVQPISKRPSDVGLVSGDLLISVREREQVVRFGRTEVRRTRSALVAFCGMAYRVTRAARISER
jgi:hypothetical protein